VVSVILLRSDEWEGVVAGRVVTRDDKEERRHVKHAGRVQSSSDVQKQHRCTCCRGCLRLLFAVQPISGVADIYFQAACCANRGCERKPDS
jgi:hypothetical protein